MNKNKNDKGCELNSFYRGSSARSCANIKINIKFQYFLIYSTFHNFLPEIISIYHYITENIKHQVPQMGHLPIDFKAQERT